MKVLLVSGRSAPALFFFFRKCLCYYSLSHSHMNFGIGLSIFTKKVHCGVSWDLTEYTDQFEENWLLLESVFEGGTVHPPYLQSLYFWISLLAKISWWPQNTYLWHLQGHCRHERSGGKLVLSDEQVLSGDRTRWHSLLVSAPIFRENKQSFG